MNDRPVDRANNQASSAVRRLPTCRSPDGLGANRPAPWGAVLEIVIARHHANRDRRSAASCGTLISPDSIGSATMTDDPAVRTYLVALAERCFGMLGSGLIGVYAAGSLALDAYQSGRSDIDVA